MNPTRRREFANKVDAVVRSAYGREYDGEELHAHLAARLGIGVSSWYGYLNSTTVLPAALVGDLARVIYEEKGLPFAQSILRECLGANWEVLPRNIPNGDVLRYGNTNAILKEVGESLAAIGQALEDGQVDLAEYRKVHAEIEEARLALLLTDERLRECALSETKECAL